MKDNEIYNQAIDDIFTKIVNNKIKGIKMDYPPEALIYVFGELKKRVPITEEDHTKFIIRKIKDRAINNIIINEFDDDREPELDLTHFMEIIEDDLKNYKIIKI